MQKFARIEIRFPLDKEQFPHPDAVEAIAEHLDEILSSSVYEIEDVVVKSFVLTPGQEEELYLTGQIHT